MLNIIGIILYLIFPPPVVEFILLPVLMIFLFFIIVLTAFRSSSIFTHNQYHNFTKKKAEQIKIREETIKTNQIVANIDYKKLSVKMDKLIEEEIYLNPKLNLQQFSNNIQEPAHHISIVLKHHYKMNFYDFMNSNRVNYAIRLLSSKESKNMSIEGIGLSAGFNSRTSMYRAFKKFTGKTPSDFTKH